MKATIKDVAKYAGVSVATVSRYLNHSPLIAEASVEKVRQAIEELDYQPSMMASGLLHGSSRTVALAVDRDNAETYGNEFFLQIQYGIEHELTGNGYYLMICHIGAGEEGVAALRALINGDRIDGLVLLSEMAKKSILDLLSETQLPYVIVGRSKKRGAVWVDSDNIEAGYRAAERLIKTGAEEIGFLSNSRKNIFVEERYQGYCAALRDAGLSVPSGAVTDGLSTPELIADYVNKHHNSLCEAYVASDSAIAFYFMRELCKRGISVPDRVQVIGFDDSILAEAADPAMTVVEIYVMKLGISAANILIGQMRESKSRAEHRLLSVGMIERGSTKPIRE